MTASRVPVVKTYKIYIDGKFPRTESGRYFPLEDADGKVVANLCRGSRKDFRNAVVAARNAFPGWSATTAYLRGQILYRIAEMLEGRSAQFVDELQVQGVGKRRARQEVEASIDRLIYYAGWSDKYQQIFSAVNPVSSSHFNFSVLEPTGVVSVLAPDDSGLLGLVSNIAPVIVGDRPQTAGCWRQGQDQNGHRVRPPDVHTAGCRPGDPAFPADPRGTGKKRNL